MLYISGIYALNLNCFLETCGDWHQSSLDWSKPVFRESAESFYGDYGIESGIKIPESECVFNAANHIRAILDLIVEGNFGIAQGMNEDYICNTKYDDEIFSMVIRMKNLKHWDKIDEFMGREYLMKWLKYKKEVNLDELED